jgi:5-formyltetrahydrofolate cyclo-ligase
MKKSEIRSKYKRKRIELNENQIDTLSSNICSMLLSKFEFRNKTVSLFLPIKNQHEIDTFQIWQSLKNETTITISKSNFSTNEMNHYKFISEDQLEINSYGIPEPISGEMITESEIDYVLVPLLACDNEGNRIGYGKGFYDRFMDKCSKDCVFIGLHLFDEFEQIDDVRPTDIKLHYCVTPNKIYKFPIIK